MLIPTSLSPLRMPSFRKYVFWNTKPCKRRKRYGGIGCIERLEDRALLSAPTFDQSSYQIVVSEDSETPADIGGVMATDADEDPLDYSIVSGDPEGVFGIDPEGNVTLEGEIDYESQSTYNLSIEVSDGTDTDTATVTVTVTDVYENPVISSFEVTQDFDNVWIFSGTVEHADPGSVTISFGGFLDGESVAVDEDGSFTFAIALDPEDEGLVTAQAEDADGLLSIVAEELVVQP